MNNKFTFHVLGLSRTITNKDSTAYAYTRKAWKFCKMIGSKKVKIEFLLIAAFISFFIGISLFVIASFVHLFNIL